MILKVVDENDSTIGAVHVYENNENGELSVHDTYHIKDISDKSDSVFGTNETELVVTIDIGEFKVNCIIAGEVYNKWDGACEDEEFYKNCMSSICDKLEVESGVIPDRAYEIWSIIEEEYL